MWKATRVAYVIGLTRLVLAGIDDPHLELGNSLERTSSNNPQSDGFDVVLANPPWGMRIDPKGLDHFPVRTKDTTGLFIQHALSQLRPGGRAVIVVPQGVLSRGGPEQRLRQMLLEQHTVEAVVALPETAFMPYTVGKREHTRAQTRRPYRADSHGRRAGLLREGQGPPARHHPHRTGQTACRRICVHRNHPSIAGMSRQNHWPKSTGTFHRPRRDKSSLDLILDQLKSEIEVVPLKEMLHCSKWPHGAI